MFDLILKITNTKTKNIKRKKNRKSEISEYSSNVRKVVLYLKFYSRPHIEYRKKEKQKNEIEKKTIEK